jgi:hypothetical protein
MNCLNVRCLAKKKPNTIHNVTGTINDKYTIFDPYCSAIQPNKGPERTTTLWLQTIR